MRDDEDGSDIDAARRYRRRLKKQRIYQENYRERQAAARKPDREQIAAAFLSRIIRQSAHNPELGKQWLAQVVRQIGHKFDPDQIEAAFACMVRRERKRLRSLEQGGGNA